MKYLQVKKLAPRDFFLSPIQNRLFYFIEFFTSTYGLTITFDSEQIVGYKDAHFITGVTHRVIPFESIVSDFIVDLINYCEKPF